MQSATESSKSAQENLREYQLADGLPAVVRSQSMRNLMELVERVAHLPTAVLIHGETGSGKELIARSIHQLSIRCNKPFIDINCAALPEHLVESELFGHEKGAFSGADQMKPGFFEMANGGTLFLDEIGELEARIQVKLLRVLDGVPYYRLGGTKKVGVDVRIIAATNSDLQESVKTGKFRQDLYHRLSQFQLRVPPLRERPEDTIGIAEFVLQYHMPGAKFAPGALDAIQRYGWPGNIRELKNVILRSIMNVPPGQRELQPNHLPPELRSGLGSASEGDALGSGSDLSDMEKQLILRTLRQTGGHRAQAAELLGISRRTLARKLKLYQIQDEVDPSVGIMSREQQRYYRAAVEFPVQVKTSAGKEFQCASVNISTNGFAVQAPEPIKAGTMVTARFKLPGSHPVAETKAEIVWCAADNKLGLRLVDVPTEAQQHLDDWLTSKMEEEGWVRE